MFRTLLLAGLTLSLLTPETAHAQEVNHAALRGLFAPLPARAENPANQVTNEKITLGRRLFNDTIFSQNKDISCNSCHNLATYGVDNEPTSSGHKAQRGGRNSPTVYNSALHFVQFWDGRAADVEAQALGPVLNPVEMAMASDGQVLERIREDKSYDELFSKAFPDEKDPITFKNFGKAIGAFERTLLTPGRFDEYLKGNDKALNADEIKGMTTFRDVGCVACHNGATVGGQMYQKLGLVKPYPTKDTGRMEVTKNEADKFFFKVPSLRNIEKTGPYFHDGSVNTLEQAVKLMGEHQLGRTLTEEQTGEIVTFLKALTSPLPKN